MPGNEIQPVSKVVLLPSRTKLIELNSTLARAVARRLKPSRATRRYKRRATAVRGTQRMFSVKYLFGEANMA